MDIYRSSVISALCNTRIFRASVREGARMRLRSGLTRADLMLLRLSYSDATPNSECCTWCTPYQLGIRRVGHPSQPPPGVLLFSTALPAHSRIDGYSPTSTSARVKMFCNSALLSLALAVAVSASPITQDGGIAIALTKRGSLTHPNGTFNGEKAVAARLKLERCVRPPVHSLNYPTHTIALRTSANTGRTSSTSSTTSAARSSRSSTRASTPPSSPSAPVFL